MGTTDTKLRVNFKGVDKTKGALNKMRQGFKGFAMKAGAALVAAFAVKAITSKSLEIIEQVHAIGDEARQLGTNSEFLQKFTNALGQVGLEATVAKKSLEKMKVSLATKTDAKNNIFEQMKLSADDLKKLSTEQMFLKIGSEISKLPNEVDKVKASYEIFGKAGAKLVPLFRQGPEAFTEGLKGTMDMMSAVDQKTVDMLSNVDDTFAAVKNQMFVDFAQGLGAIGEDGQEAFGSIEVAIFATFLKARQFVLNTAAGFTFLKDAAKAVFTEDTIGGAFDEMNEKILKTNNSTKTLMDNFKTGLEAKNKLAGQFDETNTAASKLKKNITAIKNQLSGLTLAGSIGAIQAQFKGVGAFKANQPGAPGGIPAAQGDKKVALDMAAALKEIAMNTRLSNQKLSMLNFGVI